MCIIMKKALLLSSRPNCFYMKVLQRKLIHFQFQNYNLMNSTPNVNDSDSGSIGTFSRLIWVSFAVVYRCCLKQCSYFSYFGLFKDAQPAHFEVNMPCAKPLRWQQQQQQIKKKNLVGTKKKQNYQGIDFDLIG